jgi:hypothetical protein
MAANQFFNLNAEQRRFLWRKQISDTRTPAAWLELFRPLGAFETVRGKAGCLPVILGVGALALVVGGVAKFTEPNGAAAAGILWALALVAAALLMVGRRLRLRGRRLQPVLNPLLAVFREDLRPGDALTLSVDLRGAERPANRVARRQLPLRGSYSKIVETTFADKWLQGEAVLADGTRLVWELTEFVRREERTKRNARGKVKSKTKCRAATHLRLEAGWRRDRFARRAPSGEGGEWREDDRRIWLRLRRTFRQEPETPFDAGQFVQTVAAGYAQVEAREGGK